MKLPSIKLKPASKSSSFAHIGLNVLLACLILLFIREPISLPVLSITLLLLSKWRIFAVKPRFWPANVRANLIDITVGLSVIIFMSGTNELITQFVWLCLYIFWLLILKPKSSSISVSTQAIIGQTLGLLALYGSYSDSSIVSLVLFTWIICYGAARHFFSAFDEKDSKLYSHIWGLFGAQMAWILSHWQLTYTFMPQVALIITIIGYSIAYCFYLHETRGLRASIRNQFIIFTAVILIFIALFSEWQYQGI